MICYLKGIRTKSHATLSMVFGLVEDSIPPLITQIMLQYQTLVYPVVSQKNDL